MENFIKRKRTSDEQWFKDVVYQLRHQEIWWERVKLLLDRVKEATPNCIAQYSLAPGGSGPGDQTANMALRRAEWQIEIDEKQNALKELDAAMSLLSDEQRTIIELRYIKDLRDWHIYDLGKIPAGKTLYYQLRDDAITVMAKYLGFLETAVKMRSTSA